MVEAATTEFWKDIKPIVDVFKPDAQPEAYIGSAAIRDNKYFVPFTETVSSRPLWISPTQNKWCDILRATKAGLVSRHYHPHGIFSYTISGKWGYLEHDWTAKAGDFLYEAPGGSHTLVTFESPEPMMAFFVVQGPLIWLNEEGSPIDTFDVHNYLALCRDHFEKVGIGRDYVDTLIR
jgi:2,4'-dihydroxyacetophenone dioxygenase